LLGTVLVKEAFSLFETATEKSVFEEGNNLNKTYPSLHFPPEGPFTNEIMFLCLKIKPLSLLSTDIHILFKTNVTVLMTSYIKNRLETCITGHSQGSKFKQTRCTIPTDVKNFTEPSLAD